jgi:hypothetical protein
MRAVVCVPGGNSPFTGLSRATVPVHFPFLQQMPCCRDLLSAQPKVAVGRPSGPAGRPQSGPVQGRQKKGYQVEQLGEELIKPNLRLPRRPPREGQGEDV